MFLKTGNASFKHPLTVTDCRLENMFGPPFDF